MEEPKKPSVETKKLTNQEIVSQYNKAKRQYTAFFQKTIEIEDELSGTKYIKININKNFLI